MLKHELYGASRRSFLSTSAKFIAGATATLVLPSNVISQTVRERRWALFISSPFYQALPEQTLVEVSTTALSATPHRILLSLPGNPLVVRTLPDNSTVPPSRKYRFTTPPATTDPEALEAWFECQPVPATSTVYPFQQIVTEQTPTGGTIRRHSSNFVATVEFRWGDLAPGPFEREVRRVIAYANNPNVQGNDVTDRKEIAIPDNYSYISHSLRRTTANPNVDGGEGRWSSKDGVIRAGGGNGRITGVFVEVRAGTRSSFGHGIWIGMELSVVMQRQF